MARERLRERLEDQICRECVLEAACSDNMYYCEAFSRLLALVKVLAELNEEAGDLLAQQEA